MKKNKITCKEIVSLEDKNTIIETIIDSDDNYKLKLFCFDKNHGKILLEEKVEYQGSNYQSISKENSLVTTGTIKFCSSFCETTLNKNDLIMYIRSFIDSYVDCSDEYLIILSYYVLFTYFYKSFEVIPYLRVIGDYGSGKSQLLKTIGNICYNPIFMNGSASLATTFRTMDKVKGTLIFDEADIKGSDTTNEFIKILNNGYQKGMPVLRAEGDDFNPTAFDVFCPKIIGGRMEFSDKATESRCLSEIMKRSKRNDLKDLDDKFYKDAEHIRNMCFSFKLENINNDLFNNSYSLDGLEPRIKQILKPILSLIEIEEEANIIISRMKSFQEGIIMDRHFSLDGIVFKIIKNSLSNGGLRISIKDIADEINLNQEYYLKNITPRSIASLLRQNGLNIKRLSEGMFIDFGENIRYLEELFSKYNY